MHAYVGSHFLIWTCECFGYHELVLGDAGFSLELGILASGFGGFCGFASTS